MSSLYDLADDILTLQQMMEQDADDNALADTLEAVQGDAEYKLECYAKVIKNLEADVEAFKSEEQRFASRRATLENKITWLKRQMFEFMKFADMPKVKGDLFTISIANNGGKLPVVVDVDVNDLPDEACKIKREPNSVALAKLIDAGNCKYAHYGERGQHLSIR